jgi:uncharacterized protein (DUF934 family)
MAAIIRNRSVVNDSWRLLRPGADGRPPAIPLAGDIIVPLNLWRGARADLLPRVGRIGVWLESHEDPAEVAEDLKLFGVVAVDFPKSGDGRGYSTARLLRSRYGWRGELRAIGDIFRDHLHFLAACGFDSFALRSGEDPHQALAAFEDFSEAYQSSAERPLPLFRRRRLDGFS